MGFICDSSTGFTKDYCHQIIQLRQQFLHDRLLPNVTHTKNFPPSHCPLNIFNNFNHQVFKTIVETLIPYIETHYQYSSSDCILDDTYYVENSYTHDTHYYHCDQDYMFAFVIVLSEPSQYKGGEIILNGETLDSSTKIVLFAKHETFQIRNILLGEQHKLVVYIRTKTQPLSLRGSGKNSHNGVLLLNSPIISFPYVLDLCNCNMLLSRLQAHKTYMNAIEETPSLSAGLHYIKINHFYNTDLIELISSHVRNHRSSLLLKHYNIPFHNIRQIRMLGINQTQEVDYLRPYTIPQSNASDETAESKFSLLILINHIKGKFVFPSQIHGYEWTQGHGLCIPHSFLFPFAMTITETNPEEPAFFIELVY